MKKGIIMSLLLMFLLTGCFVFDDGVENLKKPDVYVDDIKIDSWEDDPSNPDPDYKVMGYYITNNSKYTLTYLCANGTTSNGTKEFHLFLDETLLPGERSTDSTTPGADTLEDVEFTNYTYNYIDDKDNTNVQVNYDVKLDKYQVFKMDND